MSKMLHIEINLDNSAFEEDRDIEIARILFKLANEFFEEKGIEDFHLYDINGNKVGKCLILKEK